MSTTAITYIGHATTVIQRDGVTLYTDPHFGQKALFCKRRRPVPMPPESLPKPDAILISHAHFDHLDLHSFKYFSSKIPVLIPYGLSRFLGRFIRNPLVELTPESSFTIQDGVEVRAVPVRHPGGRLSGIWYRESSGFLIGGPEGHIFFPGDTAYDPKLKDLAQYGHLLAILLPIGPTAPRWVMRKRHLTAELALQLGAELEAEVMIPIHWGVFRLGLEAADATFNQFKQLLADSPLRDRVVLLEPGQTWTRH